MPKTPKLKEDSDYWFPRFAALDRCLLVDSSDELRQDIIKSIKASLLFEEVLESRSLVRVAKQLQTIRFDACIFGPTLSALDIANFISKQKAFILSEDCAFIALQPTHRTMYSSLSKHTSSILFWPCSKRRFMEGCVKGILKANKGTVWPGVKLDDSEEIIIQRDGAWITLPTKDPGEDLHYRCSPKKATYELEQATGHSDTQILETVKRLIEHMNTARAAGEVDDPFFLHFEACVLEWQAELDYLSVKEAVENLRNRICSYKQDDEQQ